MSATARAFADGAVARELVAHGQAIGSRQRPVHRADHEPDERLALERRSPAAAPRAAARRQISLASAARPDQKVALAMRSSAVAAPLSSRSRSHAASHCSASDLRRARPRRAGGVGTLCQARAASTERGASPSEATIAAMSWSPGPSIRAIASRARSARPFDEGRIRSTRIAPRRSDPPGQPRAAAARRPPAGRPSGAHGDPLGERSAASRG